MKPRTLAALLFAAPLASAQQPFVRLDQTHTRSVQAPAASASATGPSMLVTGATCGDVALATHNQPVPGGGTLNPVAFINPANVAGIGRIAFFSQVNGSARNQGVFTADASGLHPIAIGCGNGGGGGNPGTNVGDPSPIGGNFTGFFGGTPFVPAVNAAGDVLFMADVFGGSAPRGLFLYRAATQSIVKVAAVGDASPAGGTLAQVGVGSLNAAGIVVFLANGQPGSDNQILRWQNGVLTKVARAGDPAPSGGNYSYLGSESFGFVDGTSIPTGPVPDVDDAGNIVFRGITPSTRGFVYLPVSGSPQWYLRAGDPCPSGGAFLDPWAPILANSGEVAFYADVQISTGNYTGGWYIGTPGNWRKAIEFYDVIDSASCVGLAVSRNPMTPLSDDGDLVAWATLDYAGVSRDALILVRADGTQELLRKSTDTTSIGGSITAIDAWPSLGVGGQATLNCANPGAAGGALSAHFLLTLCPLVESYCTAGTTASGCTALIDGSGTPSASATSGFTIDVANVPGQRYGLIFYGIHGRLAQPWGTGSTSWLCVKAPQQRSSVQSSGGTSGQCDGALGLDFNAYRAANPSALGQPLLAGRQIDAQGWFRDPGVVKSTSLSDALEFWLAP